MRELLGRLALLVALVLLSAPAAPSIAAGVRADDASESPAMASVQQRPGPGDDLVTSRVLLAESGAANLTLLAGGSGCAVPQDDAELDPNPDAVFTAVFAACCRVCSKGKACGDSCIAASLTCHKGVGCACDAAAPPVVTPRAVTTTPPLAAAVQKDSDGDGPGTGTVMAIGGAAALGAWAVFRRRRRDP